MIIGTSISPFSLKKPSNGISIPDVESFLSSTGKYFTSDVASLLNDEIKGTGQKFSIEIWCKRVTVDGTFQTIFSRDNNTGGRQFACEFTSNEEWSFFIADDASNYSWWKTWFCPVDTDKWYHFVMTFDNTQSLADKCKIFINGEEAATYRQDLGAGVADVNDQPTEPIYINVTNFGGLINPFKGYLSKVTFYDDVITSSDVTKLWNSGHSADNATVDTSIPCFMAWNAIDATFSTNFLMDDSIGTTYGVSKQFTSTGMVESDRKNDVYPTPYTYSVHADSTALIAEMSSTPSATRQLYIDEFIRGCVLDGNWAELDALWFMAAHDQQAGTLNWKSPATFALQEISSIAWTADEGYTGDGSADYLETNFNPSTNGVKYTLNSNSMGVYLRSNINEGTVAIGHAVPTSSAYVIPRSSGLFVGRDNCNTSISVATSDCRGLNTIRRTASNAQATYRNGKSIGTSTAASVSIPNNTVQILCYNNNGTPALFSTNQASCAFLSSGGINQLLINARVRNYMVRLGKQV